MDTGPSTTDLPICCGAARCAGRKQYTYDPVRPTVREFLAMGRTSSVAELPVDSAPAIIDRSSQRWRDAAHEAGHIVVADALRFLLAGATLDPPTAYIFPPDSADVIDNVAMMLAGSTAERWIIDRHIFHQFDGFWRFFINAARAGNGGTCDECRAAAEVLTARPDADDHQIVAALREGEQRAIDILTPDAATEITTALAERLFAETRLNAAAVDATIREKKGTTTWR